VFEYFANLIVFQWMGLLPGTKIGEALHFFFYDTPKILVLLTIAIFVISIIRSYFPPEKTKEFLSRKHTVIGNILAAFIGVVTPFCSCSAVPLFIGFIEAGVPLGVTFSFLIASPMVNEIAVVMLWGMFGGKVAAIYMASGVMIAVIGGYIIGKLNLEHLVEDNVYQIDSCGCEMAFHSQTFAERCREAAQFTTELLQKLTLYIVVAIAIGGFIHGYVPEDFLVQYAGRDNSFAVPLVVAIGIPLYNSAAGMVPIAYALMEKGLPLGTVLAFMMSVAALSFPEMIILRNVLKVKLIGIFVGIIAIAIIFTGYLFNMLM
jgi:uncharacterized protein